MINAQQQKQLTDHIAHWESKTDAEFIVVITKRADFYRHTPILIAALIALLTPFLLLLSPFWLNSYEILLAQWLIFILVTAIGFIPCIHRYITPRHLKNLRAQQLARVQFFENNLHHTRHASGVLIFISEFEQYIEILADRGINAEVQPAYWSDLIKQLHSEIKRGNTSAGLIKIIDHLGIILVEKFPSTNLPDELPNNIIML
jgi:putative membrane protein